MSKMSTEYIQEIIDNTAKIVPAGATISVTGFLWFDPSLVIDFLNADPKNSNAIWHIYRDVTKTLEDLRNWANLKGYHCDELMDLRMYSKEEFLEQYSDIQSQFEKAQKASQKAIDEKHFSDITPITLTIDITNLSNTILSSLESTDSKKIRLHFTGSSKSDLWLPILLAGVDMALKVVIDIRQCIAPDCGKYFIPTPRGREQTYHSLNCRKKHYMRQRRARQKA